MRFFVIDAHRAGVAAMKRGGRCRARLEPGKAGPYHGRCDLPAGHTGPHYLERGHDEVRWSTEVWK